LTIYDWKFKDIKLAQHFGVVAGEVQIEVKKKSKHDMRRDRDSRGRFLGCGRSLIPTNPLTSPRF